MLKKIFHLIFITNLLMASEVKECTCSTYGLSPAKKIAVCGTLGVGAIITAPYVLPAGTLAAIYSAAATAAAKAAVIVVPTTVAGKISLGLTVAQLARPYILQTTEEELHTLLKERNLRSFTEKNDFVRCLKANKNNLQRNSSRRPEACEDAALLYAFSAGINELNKKTEAFNTGKCYCK